MLSGLVELPVWGYVLVTLACTHVTIVGVTIYLHRCQAHRALDLHPAVANFLRLWLWLSTGMETKQWVAVHRKHHAYVETPDDPHSPQVEGIGKVLLEGAELYRRSSRDPETLERFGHGTPDDWLEHHVYKHSVRGVAVMLITDVVLFGPIGLTMWAVQMMWIPFFAAGVINGVGHWGGYRNYETADASTNILPVGILIGGEELHNNHHAFASSAKFSSRWWELDIGWLYLRVLSAFGLARIKKIAPRPILGPGKDTADSDTLAAVISGRFQVMSRYAATVLTRVHAEELERADVAQRGLLKSARRLLIREESRLSGEAKERLAEALTHSQSLKTVYEYKRRLQMLWEERSASHDRLLQSLQQWCREAEASGIRALEDFARTLPSYTLSATAV